MPETAARGQVMCIFLLAIFIPLIQELHNDAMSRISGSNTKRSGVHLILPSSSKNAHPYTQRQMLTSPTFMGIPWFPDRVFIVPGVIETTFIPARYLGHSATGHNLDRKARDVFRFFPGSRNTSGERCMFFRCPGGIFG